VADHTRTTGETVSQKLRGLLTVLSIYLIAGARSSSQEPIKATFPIMARTNFVTMYRNLPEVERIKFDSNPDALVWLALASAGMSPQAAEGPVFVQGVLRGGERKDWGHITRRIWLAELTGPNGKDVLSSAGYLERNWGRSDDRQVAGMLGAMGGYGSRTDADEAMIFELRRMLHMSAPWPQWEIIATRVFDIVRQANSNPQPATQSSSKRGSVLMKHARRFSQVMTPSSSRA
jgi:hypothetical protein